MDETDFVNLFCNKLADSYRGLRAMYTFYVFEDKRPGEVTERFLTDAREFEEFARLRRP